MLFIDVGRVDGRSFACHYMVKRNSCGSTTALQCQCQVVPAVAVHCRPPRHDDQQLGQCLCGVCLVAWGHLVINACIQPGELHVLVHARVLQHSVKLPQTEGFWYVVVWGSDCGCLAQQMWHAIVHLVCCTVI